jgi:PHP family Zn ribbon phosphoesterase
MIRAIKQVKSANAVSVTKEYDALINKFGPEFKILTDSKVQDQMRKDGQAKLADLIVGFREHKIDITPGGGGHYGEIQLGDFE